MARLSTTNQLDFNWHTSPSILIQHTGGHVIAAKETRTVRAYSYKAGRGEVAASPNPLWQPEFPGSWKKNGKTGQYEHPCFLGE